MEHEIYVSREVKNLGHNEAAALIKKAAAMALARQQLYSHDPVRYPEDRIMIG